MDVRIARVVRHPATIAVGAVLAALAALLVVLTVAQRGRALPNTTVSGVVVGRMTPDELRVALGPVVRDRETRPVAFVSAGDAFPLDPAAIAYRIDVDATVESVMGRGRRGGPIAIAERLLSLGVVRDLPLVDEVDEAALDAWVAEVMRVGVRTASDGTLTVDPATLAVEVSAPHGARDLEPGRVRAAAVEALRGRRDRVVELPAVTTPTPVDPALVTLIGDRVRAALAEPLRLTSQGAELRVEPEDLAALLRLRGVATAEGRTVELVVDAAQVEARLGTRARQAFDVDPVDARYVVPRVPPVRFDEKGSATFRPVPIAVELVRGRDGTRYSPRLLAEQLPALVLDGTREAEADLVVTPAGITDEVAEQGRPTHLLGTFTTYFTPGQARNVNIQRLADALDGTLVLPGAQFSVNDLSGPRSCDRGYVLAGTIVAGELVDTCGGGTSQFGTTTFNAAFFAGLQLDQWKAHSWYLSRYPMGREATLTYPTLDVRFTNTTEGNLLVRTAHTDDSVTVSIYGRPQWVRVSATLGPMTDPRGFATRLRPVADLEPGQERVVQAGAGGFTVTVTRTLEAEDGTTTSRTIRTVYSPQARIVEVGGLPPQPPPEPPAEG